MSDSLVTLCTVACQVSLSMWFSRQKYWSGLPFPSSGIPIQGSNLHLRSLLHWQADSLPLSHVGSLHNRGCVCVCVCVCVWVAQLCLTLWDPMDCSLSGSSVHGILQARILEWVTMLCSKGSSWPRYQTQVFCIVGRFFTILATWQAPNNRAITA